MLPMTLELLIPQHFTTHRTGTEGQKQESRCLPDCPGGVRALVFHFQSPCITDPASRGLNLQSAKMEKKFNKKEGVRTGIWRCPWRATSLPEWPSSTCLRFTKDGNVPRLKKHGTDQAWEGDSLSTTAA